jgi:hypothetical protein
MLHQRVEIVGEDHDRPPRHIAPNSAQAIDERVALASLGRPMRSIVDLEQHHGIEPPAVVAWHLGGVCVTLRAC